MALSLKTRGLVELRQIRNRAIRQHMLGRISNEDKDWIVSQVNAIEARIIYMDERGPDQET